MGKDVVSRTWRKVKVDWDAWSRRDLTGEDVVRLILDDTVVRVRLDRKATNISLLVALDVRRDGQKVLLAVKNMGGESEAAWRGVLDGTARPGWSARWRHCGRRCPRSAARFTSTATSWPTRQMRCTRRSRPTTPT